MLPFDMLPERHLQQSEPHMNRLNYVAFASQIVTASRRFPSRHFAFDLLESLQHLVLQFRERRVQDVAANLIDATTDQTQFTYLLERQIAEDLFDHFLGQIDKIDSL